MLHLTIIAIKRKAALHLLCLLALAAVSLTANTNDKHQHDDANHHEHQEHDNTTVMLQADIADKANISTAIAGPGTIERHIQVYGRLITPPGQMATAKARFPGLITKVFANIGDHVSQGDILAHVESNQSLRDHPVLAPINGIIQSRQANVGEIADQNPLFTLIDNRQLWAELKVFPSQRVNVKTGLSVHIVHRRHEHDSVIEHITPGQQGQPYVLACVKLDNQQGEMAPGEMVAGQIDVETLNLPLVIEKQAIQTLRGKPVIFIQNGLHYTAAPLKLGRSDNRYTEVLDGIAAGEKYVVNNSYLLKADLEKASAEHVH